jgi:HK97 family phage prohead protease
VPYTKDCPARVKAAGEADGLQPGQFTALVSVFGNKDSVGDVVMPGAFTKTLADWQAKGDPIPVIWSHDWGDPFSHIGHVTDAKETPDGLQVTGQIDMDNPKAEQVYRLLKGRRVTQFSFAYDIEDGAPAEKDGQEVFELKQLKLHEVGPTLVGANQETELLAAKAHGLAQGLKEGRVLAAKHISSLKEAHAAIGTVIAAAEPEKTAPAPSGRPGARPADDTTSSAQAEAVEAAQEEEAKADDTPHEGMSEKDLRTLAQLVADELEKRSAAASRTEDETKSSPRERVRAAKAGPASLRLRTDLEALEAEVSTLTG